MITFNDRSFNIKTTPLPSGKIRVSLVEITVTGYQERLYTIDVEAKRIGSAIGRMTSSAWRL